MSEASNGVSFRVLITRPADDAELLSQSLAARGIVAMVEPLLAIQLLDGPPLALDRYQAVLATSANGVRALAKRTPRRDIPLLAVGDGTARTARAAGFGAVDSAQGDVTSLAALAVRLLVPCAGPLLHVAGTVVAGDLAQDLRRRGFVCDRIKLYEARPITELSPPAVRALASGVLHGVLLFSPRTARTFVRLVVEAQLENRCGRLVAFCLSQAVAEAVVMLPWQRVIVAERPEQAALIEKVLIAAADALSGLDR